MKTTIFFFGSWAALVAGLLNLQAEILLPQGGEWQYLVHKNNLGEFSDPAPEDLDGDFTTTWNKAWEAEYDGPDFVSGEGRLGFGVLSYLDPGMSGGQFTVSVPLDLNIWDQSEAPASVALPNSDVLGTVYFRQKVTPSEAGNYLRISGLIHGGAFVYIDGVEVGRVNVDATTTDGWGFRTLGRTPRRDVIEFLVPVQIVPGTPVEVAVSVSRNSQDLNLGFDLAIELLVEPTLLNDDFVNARDFTGEVNFLMAGQCDDGAGNQVATRELGEPNHGGNANGGSVWYRWRPQQGRGRVEFRVESSEFDPVIAVYTGSSVDQLKRVKQFPRLPGFADSIQSEEPFDAAATVTFDTEFGEIYYIAIEGNMGSSGRFLFRPNIKFPSLPNDDPVWVVMGPQTQWEWLLPSAEIDVPGEPGVTRIVPVDPEELNSNFDETWKTAATYSGTPAFSAPGASPLGYGDLAGRLLGSDLWNMRDGSPIPPWPDYRHTAYLRTSFVASSPVSGVMFEGLINDGVIIYFNGVEVERINVSDDADANDWKTGARGGGQPSKMARYGIAEDVEIAAGETVEVAVSLHNSSFNSPDLGFAFQMYALSERQFPEDYRLSIRSVGAGEYELSWPVFPKALYTLDFSTDLENWNPVNPEPVVGDVSGRNVLLHSPATQMSFYRVRTE